MSYHSNFSEILSRLEILTNEKWILITYQPPEPPIELTDAGAILRFYQENTPEPLLISYSSYDDLFSKYILNQKVAYMYFPTSQRQKEIQDFLTNHVKTSRNSSR